MSLFNSYISGTVSPCTEDHSTDHSCLRCDYTADQQDMALAPADRDDCASNPCDAACVCEDLWQMHYCRCPWDQAPVGPPAPGML